MRTDALRSRRMMGLPRPGKSGGVLRRWRVVRARLLRARAPVTRKEALMIQQHREHDVLPEHAAASPNELDQTDESQKAADIRRAGETMAATPRRPERPDQPAASHEAHTTDRKEQP